VGEEREVSIESGRCVARALKEAGVNVTTFDITPDRLDALDEDAEVFFIALHGRFGEDGELQAILDSKGLVYTGSGPEASRLAFDKLASKQRFVKAKVMTPRAVVFDPRKARAELVKELSRIKGRYVVKPLRQGSSIGVTIADEPGAALVQAQQCFETFGDCMIEEYISGREFTVGILGDKALPIIEIRARSGFYDYHAKYVDERTEFLFNTIEDTSLVERLNRSALTCFECLGCRHFSRVDLLVDARQNVYALEINTIPGFTTHSLLPRAAAKAGLSMDRLCLNIIEAALAGGGCECAVKGTMDGGI
jgi:D-alanine-D-alanine ligase